MDGESGESTEEENVVEAGKDKSEIQRLTESSRELLPET